MAKVVIIVTLGDTCIVCKEESLMINLHERLKATMRLNAREKQQSLHSIAVGQPMHSVASTPMARLERIAAQLAVPTSDRLRRISNLLGDTQADA